MIVWFRKESKSSADSTIFLAFTEIDLAADVNCIVFTCLLSTKPCLEFLLICFTREIEGFHQISRQNEIDFTDMKYASQKISAQGKNFKKFRHGLVDERAMITTTLVSSCHWKTLAPISFRKRRPENASLKLTVICRKIIQKNNLCHPKQ